MTSRRGNYEHNYFIPCYRKFSGHHNQRNIRTAHDRKVGCNTVGYATTFLYSDWIYFLWYGRKASVTMERRPSMLVPQTNPTGSSYVNSLFPLNKFAWLLDTCVGMLFIYKELKQTHKRQTKVLLAPLVICLHTCHDL